MKGPLIYAIVILVYFGLLMLFKHIFSFEAAILLGIAIVISCLINSGEERIL